jgi:hypothetical protein
MKFGCWLVWVDYLTTLVVSNKLNPDNALEITTSAKKLMTGAHYGRERAVEFEVIFFRISVLLHNLGYTQIPKIAIKTGCHTPLFLDTETI